MADRTREHALLLLGARRRVDEPARARLSALATAPLDWDYVLSTADAQALGPLLLMNLNASAATAPAAALEHLERRLVGTTALNLSRTGQLAAVMKCFAAAGIPVAAWKGPALAVMAYGHLGARPFNDLDLLAPRDAILDARALMLASGYTLSERTRHVFDGLLPTTGREYEFVPSAPGLAAVEVQVSPAPWPLAVRLEAKDLIDRAVSVEVAGTPIPALCPEDALLALALHGTGHLWSAIRLIADIDAVAGSDLDWPVVLQRARAARIERVLAVALLLARNLFETTIAGEGLRCAQRDRVAVRLAAEFAARLFVPVHPLLRHLWRDRVYLRLREHPSDRFRYGVRQLAFEHVIRHWDRLAARRRDARRGPRRGPGVTPSD